MTAEGKAASTSAEKRILGKESGLNTGKRANSFNPAALRPISCPRCSSNKVWKDGVRSTNNSDVQRWLCRDCGYRFSQSSVKVDVSSQIYECFEPGKNHLNPRVRPFEVSIKKTSDDDSFILREDVASHNSSSIATVEKRLNTLPFYNRNCRVCAEESEAKNLAEEATRQEWAAGATTINVDVKGKIVEFLWWLKKQGNAESTVKLRTQVLTQLAREGANLMDPESVKQVVANHENWSNGYKKLLVSTYSKFVEMLGIKWEKPSYERVGELPFIPLEKEIDDLIAGCGKKTATLLQLLKETGMRIGEALALRWIDVDMEKGTVRCKPEKHSNPRMFKISAKLAAMLNTLPKKNEKVFGHSSVRSTRWVYVRQRRSLAQKLQNPRLNQITFHTFRHWKATMEYHRTKDILHVKQLLGHRCLESTLVYTQLVNFEGDDYHVATAKNLKEACELAKAGFDYFTTIEDMQIFRKRK